jgi:hypothetical protein
MTEVVMGLGELIGSPVFAAGAALALMFAGLYALALPV